jgi:hypothetical protein
MKDTNDRPSTSKANESLKGNTNLILSNLFDTLRVLDIITVNFTVVGP